MIILLFTWIADTGYCKEWRLNCDIAAEMWYDFEILVHKKKRKKSTQSNLENKKK